VISGPADPESTIICNHSGGAGFFGFWTFLFRKVHSLIRQIIFNEVELRMGEDKTPMKSNLSHAAFWYGPVALAGFLFFIAINGLTIWDRLKSTEINVEATRKIAADVRPDTAKIVLSVKHILADSAKEAASGIGKKVDDFAAFAAQLPDVTLSVLPLVIEQEVIQFGEKFARSYSSRQNIEIIVKDFSLIKKIIEQAIAVEIGDIEGTEFILASSSNARKILREKAIKEANEEASAKAKELGRSIDKIIDFSESTHHYDNSDSDLVEIVDETEEANEEKTPTGLGNNFGTIKIYQSISVKYSTR